MNNNTNTNEIKIDLGDLAGKKDEKKEVNIPMLMMMKQSVQSWCPVCDDDRMTECEKEMTPMAICLCILLALSCPPLCLIFFCMDSSYTHKHNCMVCKSTLYNGAG